MSQSPPTTASAAPQEEQAALPLTTVQIDPPSGSYSAPVRVSLVGPPSAVVPRDPEAPSSEILAPNNWHISIEHIERVADVFDSPSRARVPSHRSVFVYEGTFRVVRAGRMRICAWPQHGTYENDRIVCIYYVDNPHDAAMSRGWTVVNAPAASINHPLTSFNPFSFELSAAQRYLRPSLPPNSSFALADGSSSSSSSGIVPTHGLGATLHLSWVFDRQLTKQSEQQQTSQPYQGKVFQAHANVKAQVSTTWEWTKGVRWSNDLAEDVDSRYCLRVGREGGMTKVVGYHGEWDAGVTTEAALPIPVQYDVTPLGAVNAVFGIHSEELTTPLPPQSAKDEDGVHISPPNSSRSSSQQRKNQQKSSSSSASAAAASQNSTSGGTGHTWKDMDVSLHFASLSGSDAKPEIMYRFYGHHQNTNSPTGVKEPIYESLVEAGSILSLRVVPDSSVAGSITSVGGTGTGGNTNNSDVAMLEVKLFNGGVYIASAFFPKRSHVKASVILSDPVQYSALQVVPRAPKTTLNIENIFFGAAPAKSALSTRRELILRQIAYELENAKAGKQSEAFDAAHADPECRVLFVDFKVDISPIETLASSSDSATVPLSFYWRPTFVESLPRWTIKCLGNQTKNMLKMLSLEGGRGLECFEEAEEKNKNASVMMQL